MQRKLRRRLADEEVNNVAKSSKAEHTVILPDWTLKKWGSLILPSSIARNSSHPIQKEFLKSCEGFLRAALIVYGHPGPVWKGSYESLAMLEGN